MMRRDWIIFLLLTGITFGLYWPTGGFDLIYFDDPLVLTECPAVQAGLTWGSVKWALTSVVIANWHPVTNLSFLLVSQFLGSTPGPQHLANAILHAVNAALLFLVLRQFTTSTWRSAVVAAIFAWHPLRVESVAWIVERKDMLCAFFWLLTLLAWARRVAREELQVTARQGNPSLITRQLPLFFFALALLSKPMAVTLPFVLLLLDIWPLKRLGIGDLRLRILKPLVTEKIPFFALMFLFCVATYKIQHDYTAMTPWDKLGLAPRLHNAIAGYVAYLGQLFWPMNLAVIYPFPKSFDVGQTVLKAGLLAAISWGCVWQFRHRPWLAVGWCWYLGTALPIIGLVQVGEQAMADRYTYLPLIGPVVALVWTAADFFANRRAGKIVLATATGFILAALLVLSVRQISFWRDTVTLFTHNLAVTPHNASAQFTLGLGYEHAGDTNRAIVSYRAAKSMEPRDFQNRRNLANLLTLTGELAAAEAEYQALIAEEPEQYQNHQAYAGLLTSQNRTAEARQELEATVQLNPSATEALNNLAWALATDPRAEIRDGQRAAQLARRACELTQFQKTIYLGTFAAALAEAGKFDEAINTALRACELAQNNGESNLLHRNQDLLQRYRRHETAREN